MAVRLRETGSAEVDGCAIAGTRAQGIRVEGSQDVRIVDVTTRATRREGVLVLASPRTLLERVTVTGARGPDGIAVKRSSGAALVGCVAHDNRHGGIRVDRSHPIRSVDDLLAGGNRAAGNRRRDMAVTPPRCGRRGCPDTTVTTTTVPTPTTTTRPAATTSTTRTITTTTTSTKPAPTSTSTTTSMTTTTGPLASLRWRFYVRIALATGGVRNVDVPHRSTDAPIVIPIRTGHASAFRAGDRWTQEQIAGLNGDTLQRLLNGVASYVAARPAEYPNVAGVLLLRWTERAP